MASLDRFFSATIVAGRLHILGLARGGIWDLSRLEWREEPALDVLLNPRAGDRKVTTREELRAIVMAPPGTVAVRFLWIHEGLAEEARRLWGGGE